MEVFFGIRRHQHLLLRFLFLNGGPGIAAAAATASAAVVILALPVGGAGAQLASARTASAFQGTADAGNAGQTAVQSALFLEFDAPVLEPDLDLLLRKRKVIGDLDAAQSE